MASRGNGELVETLLAAGADVSSKDNDGRRVLIGAVGQNAEVIKLLISAGADVNAKSDSGNTALTLGDQFGVIRGFCYRSTPAAGSPNTSLYLAVSDGEHSISLISKLDGCNASGSLSRAIQGSV